MDTGTGLIDDVIDVVATTLGIEDREPRLTEASELLGSLAELDSMAIVELIVALEDRFGFEVDEDDITGDVFESVKSLAAFVEQQRA